MIDPLFREVREREIQATHRVFQGPEARPVEALLLRQRER